jgi:hypothetical protein
MITMKSLMRSLACAGLVLGATFNVEAQVETTPTAATIAAGESLTISFTTASLGTDLTIVNLSPSYIQAPETVAITDGSFDVVGIRPTGNQDAQLLVLADDDLPAQLVTLTVTAPTLTRVTTSPMLVRAGQTSSFVFTRPLAESGGPLVLDLVDLSETGAGSIFAFGADQLTFAAGSVFAVGQLTAVEGGDGSFSLSLGSYNIDNGAPKVDVTVYGAPPVLNQVSWEDNDSDSRLSTGDSIFLSFSSAIDNSGPVALTDFAGFTTDASGALVPLGAPLNWGGGASINLLAGSDRVFEVTLGTGHAIHAGLAINPNNSIKDLFGEADATPEALFFPSTEDTNGDGITDTWYFKYGLLPGDASVAGDDWDNDGLSNLGEFLLGSDPLDPQSLAADLNDGEFDSDGDGISNRDEMDLYGTHPELTDTDADGVADDVEVLNGTDPLSAYDPFNPAALRFDGTQRLTSRALSAGVLNNWTVEAWVRQSDSTGQQIVLRQREQNPPLSLNRHTAFELGLDEGVPYALYAVGSTEYRIDAAAEVTANEWTHLAAVRDADGSQLRLYVNGKRVMDVLRPAPVQAVNPLRVYETTIGGGDLGGGSVDNGFVGDVDAVRIWDYVRSGLEIQNTMGELLPEFLNGVPDANRAPLMLFNFDDNAAFTQNSRFPDDWIREWKNATESDSTTKPTRTDTAWPPTTIDSDDDGSTDVAEQNAGTAPRRSESPLANYQTLSFTPGADNEVVFDELVDSEETLLYALTNWTVEAWVRPAEGMAVGDIPLVRRQTYVNDVVTYELGLASDGTSYRPYARYRGTDDELAFDTLAPAVNIPVDEWTHLAATYSEGRLTLYINGNGQVFSDLFTGSPYVGGLGRLHVGSDNLEAELMEIRVWNRPRSAGELASNYQRLLLFQGGLLESSFNASVTFLSRSTDEVEDGLVFDYSTIELFQDLLPFVAGSQTHQFSMMAWVRMDPESNGGVVVERFSNDPSLAPGVDSPISQSLRVNAQGNPETVWQVLVTTVDPVFEDVETTTIDPITGEPVTVTQTVLNRLNTTTRTVERTITSGIDIRDGDWHHLAVVGDSISIRTYVDGILDLESPSYYTFQPAEGDSFEAFFSSILPIDSRISIAGGEFGALVDEVMVWNDAKSLNDIRLFMDSGLDRAQLEAGLDPISPLPAAAVDPLAPRHRLASYVTFDGELEMPFVTDIANSGLGYRVLPVPTGNEIVTPSTPPILVDRVRSYQRSMSAYISAVDQGDHVENFIYRNDFGYAGSMGDDVSFLAIAPADAGHIVTDSNGDGIPDWWYIQYNLDPTGPSVADEDWDNDGLNNLFEYLLDADPNDPFSLDGTGQSTDGEFDSDADGLSNSEEAIFGTRPDLADTDDDGYPDGAEVDASVAVASDYGDASFITSPTHSRSPVTERSLVASGLELAAPFSERFAFNATDALLGNITVTITEPADGSSSDVRFIDLSANITSEDPLQAVRVFINSRLVASLGAVESFTETLIINSGDNVIEVQAIDVNGGTGSDAINVTGAFAPAAIRVTQEWDVPGDLDTWLVDPQGRHRGWTANGPGLPENIDEQIPGSFLDIDDVAGTGPENITLEQGSEIDGVYQVWMNNFSHGGNPQSTVRVLVNEGTPDQQFVEFGPRAMPTSDGNGQNEEAWWLVTEVTMPAGTMNPPGTPVSGAIDEDADFEEGLGGSEGWTVEGWIRPGDLAQSGAIAAYRRTNGDEPFSVGLNANVPYVRLRTAVGGVIEVTGAAIPADQWTHVAGVYSKSQSSLRLFVNGMFVAAKPVLVSRDNREGTLYIDSHLPGAPGSVFTDALIDEVRIWARARNGGLISGQMHTIQQPSATLVAYYWFDDGGLGIEDAVHPMDRDYDLGGYPLPDLLTEAKPGPDGIFGTADDIAAGAGADGQNDHVTSGDYAPVFGNVDTDGDGLPDWWELLLFGDQFLAEAGDDPDGDGLNNLHEYHVGTHPAELDTDGDGIQDGYEDFDGDGLVNREEQAAGTNPRFIDTDNDGISDYDEVQGRTDPLSSLSPLTSRVLALDGTTTSYVSLPPEDRFALTNWVVEAWVYPTNYPAGGELAEVVARTIAADHYNYFLGLDENGRPLVKFTAAHNATTLQVQPPAGLILPLNTWTHLRGGFDATTGTLSIEVDGVAYSELNTAQRPDISGLGFVETRVGRGFAGWIDEVRIWSHEPPVQAEPALAYPQDAAALETLYTAARYPLHGNEVGLVSYLRFDDGVIVAGTPGYKPWMTGVVEDFAHIAGLQPWQDHWLRAARLRGAAAVVAAPAGTPSDVMLYVDLNGDGIPDWWQDQYWSGFDPSASAAGAPWDASADPDGDGLSNLTEFLAGTDPTLADSLGDGVPDGERDADGDGLSNEYEQNISMTRVDLVDTDDDGVSDFLEDRGGAVIPGRVSNPLLSLDPPERRSLRLNGADRVDVADQTRHALGSWTLQAWVWVDAGSDGGTVIRREVHNPLYAATGSGVNYELGIREDGGLMRPYAGFTGFTTAGALSPVLVDGTTLGEVTQGQLAPALVRPETWTHLAATYDPGTETLSLYVDGVLVAYRVNAAEPWGLGVYEDRMYRGTLTIGDGFEGYLDNVAILAGSSDAEAVARDASQANNLTASLRGRPDASAYAPMVQTLAEALTHEHNSENILVRFTQTLTQSQVQGKASQLGLAKVRSFSMVPVHVMQINDGMTVSQKLQQVRADASVAYAEPNFKLQSFRSPNDPSYASLWGMNNTGQTGGTPGADINAEDAWDRTTGNATPIVAIIDSGIDYNHPDLAANMWEGIGYDFANDDDDPMDDHGHGTHVAGTVGAVGNNGVGVAGVAWRTRLMALKFLAAGGFGFTDDAIAAIEYAVANGAKISNNSWGGYGYSQALFDAIQAAGNAGHLFVAAAGNSNFSNDILPAYPASYPLPNIISVASMDHNGNRSPVSNYGVNTVHLAAPGSAILSTMPNSSYGSMSGTSMASPHVAGVASLILSQNPGASYAALRAAILNSVTASSNWVDFVMTGGILDSGSAVGGAGTPVLLFTFDDGGTHAEDFTVEMDWDRAWRHAGTLIGATFDDGLFFEDKIDSNEDGIPDWWAETYGFDPFGPSIAAEDEDGDGLNNLNEYLAGTHPREVDTDRDGTSDANEDSDGDGLTNLQEQIAGTHPGEADSDDDGVSDADEVNGSTNPLDPYSPQNFRAMQFGGNGRVLVGTERDIDDHQNWTLEAWVKPAAAAADGIILRRAEKIDSANRWVDYELGLDAGVPYIRYAYRDGGTLETNRVVAPRAIDTRWHHLAAVMDDTDHQLRLFVNGKRVAFARPAIRPPVSAFGAFETTIGGGDLAGAMVSDGFSGQIDAVRVWNYARSGLEIQNNRHTLRPEFSAAGVPDANRAPIRLFNFDDGGDTAQNDYYTEDWLNDWIHAAELQGDADFTAAPFPPLDLDSDDDGIPDQQENTEAWDHLASESPFAYRALSFDGTGDVLVDELVDNENTAQYALTNWTIEAWVRPTALPPVGLQPLISRTDRATGLLTFELGVVRIDNALYPYARFNRADSGNDLVALNVSEAIPVGADVAWTHVAASLEDDVFSLYLNGAEAQSSTLIGALPYLGGAGEVRLGSAGFVGQMQEIRIWNEPRAADQVAADYRNALIFSSAQLQSSFQSATTYLGRSTQAHEDGLVYDYSSTLQYESVPYLAGRATHKFSLMAWVKLEQGATGGIVAERKVDVLLNDTEPDWRINHSLRITESGQPQGLWMGDVTVYNPVREDPDGDGPIGEIVVRLEAAPEVITRTITSEVDLRDGQWHHVALVGDSQRVRIYIDGRLDTEAPSYYVFKARDGESFEGFYRTYMPINSVLRMADEGFDGTLDEVMFWNEDVGEADLMQYMNLGLSRADIELGTAPIDPLPDFALDPEESRQRLISYLNFDGEIELPFIGDRINNRTEYRVLPSATGSEILNPSAPPVQSDRVLAYEMGLRGYFAAYDGGAHIENLMQRNHYGYAGVLRNGTDFVVLTADDVDHLADDADGDGLPDLWEMLYGLDSGSAEGDQGRFGDPDGDGLNNLAEYLAGTNPMAFDTDGDGISDYDSVAPGSSLSNGDRFTDNDGIADEWENQYPGLLDTDRDDASEDPDGDGWDNFSEFMAGTDPSDPSSWPTPSISARFDYLGAKDQGPIRLNIFSRPDMSGLPDAIATAGATLTQNGEVGEVGQDGTTASGSFPAVPVAPGSILLSVGCSPNTVLQFEDLGNGVLRSINVLPTRFGQIDYESGAWNVILTPTSLSPGQSVCASWDFFFGVPSFPFLGDISVVRGHIRQGPIWLQAFIDNNLDGLWNLDEPMGLAQQQPINIDWTGPVDLHIGLVDELEGYHRLSWPDTGSATYTVVVRRVTSSGSPILMRHVVTGRNYLHEGDYQAAGFYGLPADSSFRPGYQAFVGAFSTNFSFDWSSALATPQALSPVGFQTRAKVTLTWSSTSEAVQNQIEIRAGSEAGPIVWSGTIPTPFRDAGGQYRYTLPVLAGDAAMPEGVYYWRVRSLNPQQTSSYSAWKTFAVALGDSASSYSIAGEARYFGSLTTPGSVIVEAYTSAGFSGEPAARVTLTAPGSYRLGGLAAGTYSVRAWLDQDGDGELDAWETRGYLMADSSTIKSLALPTSQTGQHLSLRGRDSNNNGIADDWEYATFGALVANPPFVDSDDDGLADWEELFDHGTDPYLQDSMGDGLLDGERVSRGLDTRKMDTDEDGYADALELALGSNPLNPASTPAADDLFQIVSVGSMADRDVVTYDVDAAVGVLLRDVDVTVSYSSSLMLPFTPLSGSSRSIFTTNWMDGPWSYTNAPPAGSSLFYRIDWRLKN